MFIHNQFVIFTRCHFEIEKKKLENICRKLRLQTHGGGGRLGGGRLGGGRLGGIGP